MYRNQNYSPSDKKQKEIDFSAVDRLLEYTRATHQNSSSQIKSSNQQESFINIRPNSLNQRISLYESNQQQTRNRVSFKEIDFCQIVMFLMSAEIERLHQQIQGQLDSDQVMKNFEGMQSSINQWRLKFEQKEQECQALRDELTKIKQNNKTHIDQNIQSLLLKIEKLEKLKYQLEEQNKDLEEQLNQQKIQIQTINNKLDQANQIIKNLKNDQVFQNDISFQQRNREQFDELQKEIDNIQKSYRNLYNDYQQYKYNQQLIYEQQTQASFVNIPQKQDLLYQSNTQESQMLNKVIQQLQYENERLKDELLKQSRRSETWCC